MLEQQQILKQTISLSQRQSLEVLAMNNLDLQVPSPRRSGTTFGRRSAGPGG